MDIGKAGIWTGALDTVPSSEAQRLAGQLEELGFPTLWIPATVGRDPFVTAMLRLAAEHADGAHPYFVPVEHTAQAREILGPDRILAPEQMVVLQTDRTKALEIARQGMAIYLRAPNYVNNLKRLGFTDDDVADGGSDRLVDAIVATGDAQAAIDRVRAHFDAGASHVCVQVLG